MKNYIIATQAPALRALTAGAIASFLLVGSGLAETDTTPTNATPVNASADATTVRVVRGSDYIGTDVMSSDGRKVGDIVDYVFDTAERPRLAFVLVMTGGFVDIGGTVRAVPAAAITLQQDTARIPLTHEQYLALPKLPRDRTQYLSDPQNVAQLDQAFNVREPAAVQGASQHALVTYSSMHRRDAYSEKNGRFGYIDDVWLNLNRDRAPFVEVTPTINPFELPGPDRYAIPMAQMQPPTGQTNDFTFTTTLSDLNHAQPVEDTPGVAMVNDGFIGNTVLKVTVPKVAASERPRRATSSAGSPTGFTSSEQTPAANSAIVAAAQQIRQAFDRDESLSQANLQVVPQNDRVILQGTVNDRSLRDRADEQARQAAHGVTIDNQIAIQ